MSDEYLFIHNLSDKTIKKFKCRIINSEIFKNNFKEIYKFRTDRAMEHGFYLEFISLKLQLLDFWLRIFYDDKHNNQVSDNTTFGQLLCMCKDKMIVLNDNLWNKLKIFNDGRRNAVHKYVFGVESYESFNKYIKESEYILRDLMKFVYDNCGTEILDENIDQKLVLAIEL